MRVWHRAGLVGLLTLLVAALCAATASAHTTVLNGTVGTGDFTYDGQTVAQSSWPNMGNADNGKLKWLKTPLSFSCTAGSLTVSDKKEYSGEQLTDTFTAPQGTVLVGVLVHSGEDFNFVSDSWAADGSSATVTLDKGYSNSAIFYCTPKPPTGSITLIKHLSPSSDTGLFTLKVGETAVATNVSNNGTGTASGLAAGSYTVSEMAGTGTSLSDYDSSVSCTNEASGTTSTTVNLAAGQNVTCTFTNTRKVTPPSPARHIYVIKLAKDANGNLIPSTPTGFFQFTLTCNGSPAQPAVTYNTTPQLVGDCPTNVGGSVSEPATQGDWVNVGSATQTFVAGNGDVTLTFINQEKGSSPPPPGQCPEGTTPVSTNPLVCLKTVTNTVTNTVTQTVTVYGTPTCPAGSTQTSSGPGYVVCNTTTTVPAPAGTCTEGTPVPGSNPVVCKVTVTKVVIKKVPVKAKPKKKTPHHVVHKPKKPVHHAKPPKKTHYTP